MFYAESDIAFSQTLRLYQGDRAQETEVFDKGLFKSGKEADRVETHFAQRAQEIDASESVFFQLS